MTNRPPDDPNDPRYQRPETRPFEADQPTEAYSASEPYGQDPYGYTDQYSSQQDSTHQYGYDDRYGQPGQYPPDQPPPGGNGSGSGGAGKRTVALAAAVFAILVAIVVVVALIVRSGGSDGGSGTEASTTTSTATASSTADTTTTTTTTEETTTTTTDAVPSGSVTYQLTGGGDVVALRYRAGSAYTLVAATGAPWSQATTVTDGTAELTAIVVRGPVTCTILHGETLLSSSTSNGGPLACSAQLP